jgi:hypothetical protein
MNKTFFLTIMVALIAILSTSCTNYRSAGPGVTQIVTADTVITNLMPVLADRFDCNNNLLPDPKVEDWMVDRQLVTQTTTCGFSNEDLNGLGYFYKKVYAGDNWFMNALLNADPGWLLFWTLLFLVLLALLIWSLTRNNSNQTNTPPAQPAPAPANNQANRITRDDMSEMMKTLGKNGGSLDTRPDGSFHAIFNPAKEEKEQVKSPEVQADKVAPVEKTEETKPAQ